MSRFIGLLVVVAALAAAPLLPSAAIAAPTTSAASCFLLTGSGAWAKPVCIRSASFDADVLRRHRRLRRALAAAGGVLRPPDLAGEPLRSERRQLCRRPGDRPVHARYPPASVPSATPSTLPKRWRGQPNICAFSPTSTAVWGSPPLLTMPAKGRCRGWSRGARRSPLETPKLRADHHRPTHRALAGAGLERHRLPPQRGHAVRGGVHADGQRPADAAHCAAIGRMAALGRVAGAGFFPPRWRARCSSGRRSSTPPCSDANRR